jgi:hypothetical protein
MAERVCAWLPPTAADSDSAYPHAAMIAPKGEVGEIETAIRRAINAIDLVPTRAFSGRP